MKEYPKLTTVYIASAYTKGDVAVNVKVQLDAYNTLLEAGFAPFAPLMSHFNHMAHPQPYHVWTTVDMEWVRRCDIVLRIPSESSGADKEVEFARLLGKPVYFDIQELIAAKKRDDENEGKEDEVDNENK